MEIQLDTKICHEAFCHACNGSGYDCFGDRRCEFCGGGGSIRECS